MKKIMLLMFLTLIVAQGCNQSTKEDVKDVGQDIKNGLNKATD